MYAITPTTEATARRAATLSTVAPINRWELPAPPSRPAAAERPFDEEDARDQENTSDVYRQAMGWTADDGPDNSM